MNITEALKVLHAQRSVGAEVHYVLACSFTPLHLGTLLSAHLQRRDAEHRVVVDTGIYGDLPGNVEAIGQQRVEGAAVVFEWADLDPRLGLRVLGGWHPRDLPDIVANAAARARQYADILRRVAARVPVAVCLPTLPLPPVSYTAGWQYAELPIALSDLVADFARELSGMPRLRIVAPQHVDERSPLAGRLDVRSYLRTGFPYGLAHASVLAEDLARLLKPPVPKKGLVTDLDGTVWQGILGEEGMTGVSWDLDHKSHIHGLYQQLLQSLAEAGVLIAVASKTDPSVITEALRSKDLLLQFDRLFPIEAHWEPKSVSVSRILDAWNIGADSVVFVDDSPLELAEVKAVHPGVECLLFPTDDENAVYALLQTLRDLFGKDAVSSEDTLRLDSIRRSAELRAALPEGHDQQDHFLSQAAQELTVTVVKSTAEPRALELINKTNQFNLNGRRLSEAEWAAYLERPDALALLLAYRDRYGPLGQIAVVAGRIEGSRFHVDSWVLSCRAFTRRIEYACLDFLFEHYHVAEIVLNYRETAKNHLVRALLTDLTGREPDGCVRLTSLTFGDKRPPLAITYHSDAAP